MKKLIFIIFIFNVALIGSADKNDLFIENLKIRKFILGEIVIEKKYTTANLFDSFRVSYNSDGLRQYALLNIPNSDKKKYPVIIVCHGYISPEKYSTEKSYSLVTDYYSKNDFIVIKPDYRGHNYSEIDTVDNLSRLAYAVDVLNLIYSIASIEKADNENIFLYGHSMGGEVILKVMEVYENIRAASLWAPVSKEFPESVLYFRSKSDKSARDSLQKEWDATFTVEDYYKLSPTNYLKYIKAPIILHHGTLDDSVPYKWSEELVKLFDTAKINYKFYSYSDDHNFAQKYFYIVLKRDVEFFQSYLY